MACVVVLYPQGPSSILDLLIMLKLRATWLLLHWDMYLSMLSARASGYGYVKRTKLMKIKSNTLTNVCGYMQCSFKEANERNVKLDWESKC